MGAGSGESIDILPVGMADRFTEFIEEVKSKMTELVENANELARMLDDKDDNEENQQLVQLFKTMADGANQTMMVVKSAAENGCEKLEEKNQIVKSTYQNNCIAQIMDSKEQLSEEPFDESHLNSESPQVFTTEENEKFKSFMQEVMDKWEKYNNELYDNAQELTAHEEKNELSDVCDKIADQIAAIAQESIMAMQNAGEHMDAVNSRRVENTNAINESAESAMADVQQQITSTLKDIESALEI